MRTSGVLLQRWVSTSCELKSLCEKVQWGGVPGGGSSGRMACGACSRTGLSPLGRASWGGVFSSPVNVALTCCLASAIPGGSEITFPYFPHCDHCHFRPVRTPGFTSSALNIHCGAGGSFGGTGGGCNSL